MQHRHSFSFSSLFTNDLLFSYLINKVELGNRVIYICDFFHNFRKLQNMLRGFIMPPSEWFSLNIFSRYSINFHCT
jgi:hypothetical protein